MNHITLKDNVIISLETDGMFEWEQFTGTSLEITFKTSTPNTRSQWVSIDNVDTLILASYFLHKTEDDFKNMTADEFIQDMLKMEETA